MVSFLVTSFVRSGEDRVSTGALPHFTQAYASSTVRMTGALHEIHLIDAARTDFGNLVIIFTTSNFFYSIIY